MKKLMIIAVAIIALLTIACSHQVDVRAKLLVDNSLVFFEADSSLHLAVGDTIILRAFSDAYGQWGDWKLDEASVRPAITCDSLFLDGRHCFARAVIVKVPG